MPGNLYLATYTKVTRRYMVNRPDYAAGTRIIWAETPEQAKEKLVKAEGRDDPYGISYDIDDIEITEAIV